MALIGQYNSSNSNKVKSNFGVGKVKSNFGVGKVMSNFGVGKKAVSEVIREVGVRGGV
jgi:hypothetical protein